MENCAALRATPDRPTMKTKYIVGLTSLAGISLFWIARSLDSIRSTTTPALQLILISSLPKSPVGPIRLSSADLSPDGKDLLLTFIPDLIPFDPEDLTLSFLFYEKTPSGLVETSFHPVIDWNMWKIPVLGDKPRKLNLTSLGAFDELKIEIAHKSTVIDSRTFRCK